MIHMHIARTRTAIFILGNPAFEFGRELCIYSLMCLMIDYRLKVSPEKDPTGDLMANSKV